MGAEDVRNLQMQSGARRATEAASLALPAFRRGQVVQRAVDRRDHADGNARIMRRRGEFGMPEQRLDDPDVHAALQQVRREEWRNVCSVTGLVMPAVCAACLNSREICRAERCRPL